MDDLKKNTIYFANYYSSENKVTFVENYLNSEDFQFCVLLLGEKIMVETADHQEKIILKDVTPEQAVILFSIVLNLRDVARE